MTDLKPGVKIEYKGEPHEVVTSSFSRSSQSKGFMTTRLRNMITGSVYEVVFRDKEQIEGVQVEKRKTQFLYRQGDQCFFMDNETFEQFELPISVLDGKENYLLDGMEVGVFFYKERPIGIDLPPKIVLEVTEAEPGVKGSTISDVKKQAIVETGYKLTVPSFINIGDKIRINTETGQYVERA